MDAFLARLAAEARLPAGGRCLVAVSGGRDSMALLTALHRLAPGRGWRLGAAHFDHGLRGAAGRLDGELVEDWCRRLGLNCERGTGVPGMAGPRGLAPEAAARAARLKFLADAARKSGAAFVAAAHHADDQAELVLLRLLRGAGGAGLGGMAPVAPFPGGPGLTLVRPFLGLSRAEIAAWAAGQGMPFREDETNADRRVPRNRLRREIIPRLTADFQPALREVLGRAAEITGAEADYVAAAAAAWLADAAGIGFGAQHAAVQRAVIRAQLRALRGPEEFEVIEALRLVPGRPVNAPGGRRFVRDAEGRVAEPPTAPAFRPAERWVPATPAGTLEFGGLRLDWRPACGGEPLRLASAVLGGGWLLRHWRPGDRFEMPGLPRPARLQNIFVNRKVPAAERRRRVLAADAGGRVFWVEGLPPAPHAVAVEPAAAVAWIWSRPA
ncbi:MAG: tRNA lysidine(34) synthetase TilS [Limisphaerales bacterium]